MSSACAWDDVKPTGASNPPRLTVLSPAKPFESEPSLKFSYREARISDKNIVVRTAGGAVVISPSGDLARNISNEQYSEVNAFVIADNQLFLGYDQAAAIYNVNTGEHTSFITTTYPKQLASAASISGDFSMIYALNAIYRDNNTQNNNSPNNKKASATLPRLPNVTAAVFSSDNAMLLTASAVQGFGTAIWDTQTGKKSINSTNPVRRTHSFLKTVPKLLW